MVIDDPQLLRVIAKSGGVAEQPHFLGDIIAETQKSIAYPPVRKAGAHSTSFGAKPYFLSQKANVGQATPAPLMSTFMEFVLMQRIARGRNWFLSKRTIS